jgi:branched-chain amino acid transport system permease protein
VSRPADGSAVAATADTAGQPVEAVPALDRAAPATGLAAWARTIVASPRRVVLFAIFILVVFLALPEWLNSYFLLTMTGVVIYSIITLGLGLLIGRVGMVSLCQFVLAGLGAWVALRLSYATDLPFPVLILCAGVVTMVIGTLIGLPAIRLSGLYLALITLMAAGALTILLRTAQFPNGGSGFFGNSSAGGASSLLPRPSIARSDVAYYRYCVIAALIMFAVAAWHVRGKPGRAWAAVRQSEASAVAAGVHTTRYKIWAFALASFTAGVAGGLLAASAGGVAISQFPVSNSITLLAVVLLGGVYNLWGAVVAAIFMRLVPAALTYYWGWSTEILTILFGIGVIQVLLTAPGGIVEQMPKDLGRLARKLTGRSKKAEDTS